MSTDNAREVLLQALDRLAKDVAATSGEIPEYSVGQFSDWTDSNETVREFLRNRTADASEQELICHFGDMSFSMPQDLNAELAAVSVAQLVQERMTDHLFAAWPECPLHDSHPLDPRLVDGSAIWICPADSAAVARVGEISWSGKDPAGGR